MTNMPQYIPACPFCDHDRGYISRTMGEFVVICPECCAEGPAADSPEEAIQKWDINKHR